MTSITLDCLPVALVIRHGKKLQVASFALQIFLHLTNLVNSICTSNGIKKTRKIWGTEHI